MNTRRSVNRKRSASHDLASRRAHTGGRFRAGGLLLVVGAALGFASGCGPTPPTVPVSGKVTLDGKPLPKAHVHFEPVNDDTPSEGETDANGRYKLILEGRHGFEGALLGKHKVVIYTREEDPKYGPSGKVPVKYHDGTEPLFFEVKPGGTEKADFALTSAGDRPTPKDAARPETFAAP